MCLEFISDVTICSRETTNFGMLPRNWCYDCSPIRMNELKGKKIYHYFDKIKTIHHLSLASSTAYDQCNAVMKDYISSLDEGAILSHRKGVTKLGQGKLASLGIPLSVEILVEVICFGFCSANRKVGGTFLFLLLLCLCSIQSGI